MSVFSELFTNAQFFDTVAPRTGNDKSVYRQLSAASSVFNPAALPASCAGGNEVQSIAQHVHATGGTYTLTFLLNSGQTFTTGNIAYNAANTTVQTAINSAATGVTGWADGDIVVAGAGLNSAPMTFTFSGASVAGVNHSPITVDTALMTWNAAAGTAGAVTTTTAGTGSVDAVQSIARYATTVAGGALHVTGGTFTLSFAPTGQTPFTTAAIAWNASNTTVQTAINTANGTLGDDTIVVAGAGLDAAAMTFTFSGTGVTHLAQPLITVDSTSLTATVIGTAGAVSATANGQSPRYGWAALIALGLIKDENIPEQGASPDSIVVLTPRGQFPHSLDEYAVRRLVDETIGEDGGPESYKQVLLRAFGY